MKKKLSDFQGDVVKGLDKKFSTGRGAVKYPAASSYHMSEGKGKMYSILNCTVNRILICIRLRKAINLGEFFQARWIEYKVFGSLVKRDFTLFYKECNPMLL